MQKLKCQSCGGPIEVENQFVRAVTCIYCGASYVVSGGSDLSPNGKGVKLADYPSRLSIGARGKIQGRDFHVIGRVRYTYDSGFWEEWQIGWDDNTPPAWLEEDEGYWTLYSKMRLKGEVASYDDIQVGKIAKINNLSVFIAEKRRAKLLGTEGQFAMVMPVQGQFGYATGSADDKIVSVNFWPNEIELSQGDEIEPHDIELGT